MEICLYKELVCLNIFLFLILFLKNPFRLSSVCLCHDMRHDVKETGVPKSRL